MQVFDRSDPITRTTVDDLRSAVTSCLKELGGDVSRKGDVWTLVSDAEPQYEDVPGVPNLQRVVDLFAEREVVTVTVSPGKNPTLTIHAERGTGDVEDLDQVRRDDPNRIIGLEQLLFKPLCNQAFDDIAHAARQLTRKSRGVA